jgi:MFS transporter, FHS family, glucose/mannose:H+ symporter
MQLSAIESPVRRTNISASVLAHAAFVPTGMVTVILGPLLPLLMAKWSLTDAQAGYLITAQFLGALFGTVSSSLILPRFSFRRSMAAGQLLMALGIVGLGSNLFVMAAAAVFCYGMGIGLTIPAGNLMVAEISNHGRSSALNLLNFSWSAGAVMCPLLLAAFQRSLGAQFFLYAIALLLVLLIAATVVTLPSTPVQSRAEAPPAAMRPSFLRYVRNPVTVMLGVLFFVYVGTENALGAWLASYAKRASDASLIAWMSVPSYFYGALLLGRAVAPLTLRHLSDAKQASLGALLAGLSSALLIASPSVFGIAICAFFAGLGLSTLYPIAIAFLSDSFSAQVWRIGGSMFALSTLGGASVPWLVGFVSTQSRSLRTALMVPLLGCVVMLLIFSRPQWRRLAA